ncbi:acetoacetate--CoA ligase [Aromatoleum toluclasticum]|uniref:acetoacetate--CoA ligase n=1 Tax=Aromatoleum toluclasticum TaxID=92003 RepID=UPI001D1815CE|nr:acetoacetate--CoA ligase [Aromatoleum toluclasticum]MCC4116699.1 acetoacetate--CoA ligase [Aromatoleum toluclasticum]
MMVKEGDLLWTPDAGWLEHANVTAFMNWLRATRGRDFADYDALWRWSVEDLEGFWGALWDYFALESSAPVARVLGRRTMPGAEWFPGARLNYAQHVLRRERPGSDALMFLGETVPLSTMRWEDLAGQVRVLATRLRAWGIGPGDRVAAYLPNIPQAIVALLATTAVGAVWASCSPDFGSRGVLDRLTQLSPKVLFCVDGYRYGGKAFDRRGELAEIAGALDSVNHIVYLPNLDPQAPLPADARAVRWNVLLDHPPVPADGFEFAQVPFGHPLWILFSSGTTGLPKAIVHSHGGILLEMMKLLHFHMDIHPGERTFFFTTTGWMMWNVVASSLLVGACPVLYDGNPAYPEPDVLWKMAQDSRAAFFGASPTYVDIMAKAGIVPGAKYDLSALRAIMPAGSPVSPECTAWFYDNVKKDLWVATGSGGTDCCTGFVGGVPTLPVYAGEIQARSLGVAAAAYNDAGESVVDEVGELVITAPLPSMPVGFWNDDGDARYRESYFDTLPGVWRHGDFFRVNARGGCFVLGRSDATLNRQGVRIGTAEIYRALAQLPEIDGALIVNLDLPGGRFFMPLFVKLADGVELDTGVERRIGERLRREYTPRHVPDRIIAVPAIPMTLTGKKMEVPVRKILLGIPVEQAANRNAMADPRALDAFVHYARTQRDYATA